MVAASSFAMQGSSFGGAFWVGGTFDSRRFGAGGGHMRIASLFYAQILRNELVLCKPFGYIELLIFPMPNISKKIGHRRKSFLYMPFRFT